MRAPRLALGGGDGAQLQRVRAGGEHVQVGGAALLQLAQRALQQVALDALGGQRLVRLARAAGSGLGFIMVWGFGFMV